MKKKLNAAIVIDSWKLPVFKRRLKSAGYEYEKSRGVTPNTLILMVKTDDTISLQKVVAAANKESAITRLN